MWDIWAVLIRPTSPDGPQPLPREERFKKEGGSSHNLSSRLQGPGGVQVPGGMGDCSRTPSLQTIM